MKNLVIVALASAVFFSSCAKKNSSAKVGSGGGQNRTENADTAAGKADAKADPSLLAQADGALTSTTTTTLPSINGAGNASGSTTTADPSAVATSDSTPVPGTASVGTGSATATGSSATGDSASAQDDRELNDIESAVGHADVAIEGEDSGSDEVTSDVQTNVGSLGYKQNILKLTKGNNRVSQVLSLGLVEKELIETVTYCWNGKNDQLPTEKDKLTQFYLLPSGRALVEERGSAAGSTDYVLNSCEALPQTTDKNYFEGIRTYLEMDPEELKKKITAEQIAKLKQFEFVDLEAGSASREEYVSSDGTTLEAIKTSISCVETLKAKKLMKAEVDADKKVKNRITISSGTTIYFQRPLEAKDEKGRVLKNLSEIGGKAYVVISCGK